MIGSSENRISYNGNGIATEFAYTFKILEKSDMKVLHVAADGTETLLVSDYYVDMDKSVVLYPGYAPGAEIPEQNRPPILPEGERLVLYREVPITQESALDKHWPFNVIENGLDKLTIICQQIWDRLQRSFYVSESTSTNFDPKVPIEAGKTFRVKDDGTGFEVTEDPGKVIDGATVLLKQTTEQAVSANEAATNAQNAAKEVKEIYGDGNFTPLSDLLGGLGTKLKRWGTIFANKVFATNLPIVYNSVAEMKADIMLWEGMNTKTLGYYTPNDGGGASYLIRAKADTDVDDGGSLHELSNGLVAELIIENGTVCPEQFGAKGDGVTLDIVPFENMFKFIDKHGVPYSNSEKVTYRILGTKFYNVNGLSVPNLFYHHLKFYGGGYIGDITFPSNTFYSLFFDKVQFSNNDTKLTLSPNATVEYKNIHFLDCNFDYQKVAVKYIGRSQNIHFTNCNFKQCDVAFDGNNVDMLTFSNCWFDTRKNKIERFTIRLSDDKEGQCNFENCIIVNATTNMGDNLFTTFLQTKTRASFSHCRISNEKNTKFTAVTYTDDTKGKTDSGHVTSCTFDQCDTDLNYGIVYLEGLPSIISINSCSGLTGGSKIINIDKSITDAYSIRPYMKIFVKSCWFDALFMGEIYGQDSNVDGVAMPDIYLPTIPRILKYALQRGYQAQTQHKIVPLLLDYKHDVAANTSIDLLSVKFTNNYASYHHLPPTIWVRYIAQTPNVSESVPTLDLITFTKTDGQLQLSKITLYGSTNTVYTADQLGINKVSTISMSSTKIIHGIDYGVLSGGLNSIGQM